MVFQTGQGLCTLSFITTPEDTAMSQTQTAHALETEAREPSTNASHHSHDSAVSWGAILAGAAAAAALSLILLILGTGLGLSSVSPWSQSGVTAGTFGISTILWITFTQLAASALGGYLGGRLRKKWVGIHTDESYFRDTAHGFLTWAVASLATAALLTSVIGSIASGGAQAAASVTGSAASTAAATAGAAGGASASAAGAPGQGYFIDSLFRRDMAASTQGAGAATSNNAADSSPASSTAEVGRIFANGITSGTALPPEDVRYVGQLVAQRAGISQQDAEKRVADTYNRLQAKGREIEAKAKDAADKARKASAYAALWLFVSLLIGAFIASLAATLGGRHRDF
jgi:hypothetical protein